jgi:dipeptidyl-peptidase-3
MIYFKKITSFYTHNEHWHSRFGELSGAYEECKADAVALYLSTFDDVIEVLLPSFSIE